MKPKATKAGPVVGARPFRKVLTLTHSICKFSTKKSSFLTVITDGAKWSECRKRITGRITFGTWNNMQKVALDFVN